VATHTQRVSPEPDSSRLSPCFLCGPSFTFRIMTVCELVFVKGGRSESRVMVWPGHFQSFLRHFL
jgi:hypothetical protein